MNRTKIETIKNPDSTQGYSWNPISGCEYHTPEGLCLGGMFPCYAYKLANGRLKQRYLANNNTAPRFYGERFTEDILVMDDPFYPRFWEDRLRELDPIWKSKHFTVGGASKVQPKGIFVCDMSDLFGIGIPEEWTRRVLDVIKSNPNHRFYLLTKQPQNLIKLLGGSPKSPYRKADKLPSHCWAGVTITSKAVAPIARDFLLERMAAINFLSIEPFLGKMDGWALANVISLADWVIIGACTGTELEMRVLAYQTNREVGYVLPYGNKWTLQPKIEWVAEIVRACDKAGIPVFLKDNLMPLLEPVYSSDKERLFWKFDIELKQAVLRQELPE